MRLCVDALTYFLDQQLLLLEQFFTDPSWRSLASWPGYTDAAGQEGGESPAGGLAAAARRLARRLLAPGLPVATVGAAPGTEHTPTIDQPAAYRRSEPSKRTPQTALRR